MKVGRCNNDGWSRSQSMRIDNYEATDITNVSVTDLWFSPRPEQRMESAGTKSRANPTSTTTGSAAQSVCKAQAGGNRSLSRNSQTRIKKKTTKPQLHHQQQHVGFLHHSIDYDLVVFMCIVDAACRSCRQTQTRTFHSHPHTFLQLLLISHAILSLVAVPAFGVWLWLQ